MSWRLAIAAALLVAGCRQDMHDQPRFQEYEGSKFFADGRSARPPVDGTVARGHLDDDPVMYAGRSENGGLAERIPLTVDRALLERGRERYDIYCSPCHDRAGTGHGMIVERGYKEPPSFHIDRLRSEPPGYFYNVIRNGFGLMPAYAAQVQTSDRWAIVAYIRALQRSQHAALADVAETDRAKLDTP